MTWDEARTCCALHASRLEPWCLPVPVPVGPPLPFKGVPLDHNTAEFSLLFSQNKISMLSKYIRIVFFKSFLNILGGPELSSTTSLTLENIDFLICKMGIIIMKRTLKGGEPMSWHQHLFLAPVNVH